MSEAADQQEKSSRSSEGKTSRERYRAVMSYRQARLYGTVIALLGIVAAVALLGLSGLIPTPFGGDFSKKVEYATYGDIPCPPDDSTTASPEGIKVQVLNASSTTGLASKVANLLSSVGYTDPLVGNYTEVFRGNIQIEVGPEDVAQAYTIARYFEDPIRIRMKDMPAQTVTIILGEGFHGLASEEDAAKISETSEKLETIEDCLPISPKLLENDSQSNDEQSGAQSGTQSGG